MIEKKETNDVTYSITMTRVSDGKTVEFEDVYRDMVSVDESDILMEFNYNDGNFSCNCNRHICFHRDGLKVNIADETNDYEDVQCGEGMYKVTIKNIRTGKIVYEEK